MLRLKSDGKVLDVTGGWKIPFAKGNTLGRKLGRLFQEHYITHFTGHWIYIGQERVIMSEHYNG